MDSLLWVLAVAMLTNVAMLLPCILMVVSRGGAVAVPTGEVKEAGNKLVLCMPRFWRSVPAPDACLL